MQTGAHQAQVKLSEITHQTLTMLMFVILVISIFVVIPTYESQYVPVIVKLGSAAILGLVLVTSYQGMDSAVAVLGKDADGSVGEQVFYNYALNVGLFVFLAFLVYTCL